MNRDDHRIRNLSCFFSLHSPVVLVMTLANPRFLSSEFIGRFEVEYEQSLYPVCYYFTVDI